MDLPPTKRSPPSGSAPAFDEAPLPRALADLDDISRFLHERSPPGARNVLGALAEAIDDIPANPLASPRASDPDIRVKILTRYRYKIFYSVVDDDLVEIIHFRHAARRPWI